MPFSQQMFQQKLLEFIEVCNDGYAILTADDKMLGCNQAFCDIFYQDLRTLQGLSFENLMRLSFREGKGVVTQGRLENGLFGASEVLAKHDENYMPPEAAEAVNRAHIDATEKRAAQTLVK